MTTDRHRFVARSQPDSAAAASAAGTPGTTFFVFLIHGIRQGLFVLLWLSWVNDGLYMAGTSSVLRIKWTTNSFLMNIREPRPYYLCNTWHFLILCIMHTEYLQPTFRSGC